MQKLRLGFPFKGYMSSVRRFQVPPGYMTADSRDMLVTTDGRLVQRLGSAVVGDSVTAPVGLIESKWSARARKILGLASDTLADDYPTHALLTTAEGFNAKFGTFYVRSTNSGGSNYQLGKEYGTTHYPTAVSTAINFKMIPLAYDCGAMGLTRGVTALNRQFFTPGSRSCIQTQYNVLYPNLNGMPFAWGKRWNDSSASGSEVFRGQPWGRIPCLWAPTCATPAAAVANDQKNWTDGDMFYATVIFEFEDGSYSQPFICRPPSATVTATKGGLNTVGTIQPSGTPVAFYRSLTWTFSKGPPGCVARILARTNKINASSNAATTGGGGQTIQGLALDQFLIVARIGNNTQNTYDDPGGNDNSLVVDAGQIVRFDRTWCPPTRHCFEFDQRVAVGYRRLFNGGIIIAPSGIASSRDMNFDDTEITTGTNAFTVRTVANQLQLRRFIAPWPAAVLLKSIVLTNAKTLQQVVDEVNATLFSETQGEWCAQVCPGTDPTTRSTNLISTELPLANCTGAGTTMTISGVDSFVDVAVGMLVTGGGVPANTYVTAKASNTSITTSNATTIAANTATFSVNTGDNFLDSGGFTGNVRTFCSSLPAVVPIQTAELENLSGYEDKAEIWFTTSAPGIASSQAMSFVVPNRRKPPGNPGMFMGGAPLNRGAVVCYSNGIYTLENRRGGTTGEDFDIRIYALNAARGAISAPEAVGDGWVGYWTRDGFIVTDGEREVLVTGDIWDPGTGLGDLGYEITQSIAAVAADTDASYAHAFVRGSKLWLTYRTDATTFRRHEYNFASGVESTGLAEVLLNGASRPWSAPLTNAPTVMGAVEKSDGIHLYGAVETNLGSTGDCRIDEIDKAGRYIDDALVTKTAAWSAGSGILTITGSPNDIGIGAVIASPAALAGKSVTANDSSTVIVVSPVPVSAVGSGGSVAFWGQQVHGTAYMPAIGGDEIRGLKKFHRVSVLYRNQFSANWNSCRVYLAIGVSRTTQIEHFLDAVTPSTNTDDFKREVVQFQQDERTPTTVGELYFVSVGPDARQPELWGMDLEYEVLDSLI